MAKVKLDLGSKSIPQKLTLAQTLITGCTNNANLPDANPVRVANLNAIRYSLQVKVTVVAARKAEYTAEVEAQEAMEKDFDEAISLLGDYVQDATGGDAVKIASTNFGVAEQSNAPVELLAPGDFSATPGDEAGEISMHWKPTKGARNFEIQMTTDLTGATGWTTKKIATKSRIDVQGLAPGALHLIRVRALGASGEGPWSQLVQCRAA